MAQDGCLNSAYAILQGNGLLVMSQSTQKVFTGTTLTG